MIINRCGFHNIFTWRTIRRIPGRSRTSEKQATRTNLKCRPYHRGNLCFEIDKIFIFFNKKKRRHGAQQHVKYSLYLLSLFNINNALIIYFLFNIFSSARSSIISRIPLLSTMTTSPLQQETGPQQMFADLFDFLREFLRQFISFSGTSDNLAKRGLLHLYLAIDLRASGR